MKERKTRERIPKAEVLDWLKANHPALHAAAEIDRDWIWLVADLRGDANKAVRESIKAYGFIFSRHGGHTLPSGKLGTWGHSCTQPLPFNRHGKGKARSNGRSNSGTTDQGRVDPVEAQEPASESLDSTDYEALALILG